MRVAARLGAVVVGAVAVALAVAGGVLAATPIGGPPPDEPPPTLLDQFGWMITPAMTGAVLIGLVVAFGVALGRMKEPPAGRVYLLPPVLVGGALGILIGRSLAASAAEGGLGAALGYAFAIVAAGAIAIGCTAIAAVAWLTNGHRLSKPIRAALVVVPGLLLGVVAGRLSGG